MKILFYLIFLFLFIIYNEKEIEKIYFILLSLLL